MISFKQKGNFKNTERFLTKAMAINKFKPILERYGQEGVEALKNTTPKDTGETANSWHFEVEIYKTRSRISWYNTNIVDGTPVAVLLQYGHGIHNGGFVQGVDYINPTMQPIFDKIMNEAWREVCSL